MLGILHGTAKGKTSACIGCATVAAAKDKSVLFVSFEKNDDKPFKEIFGYFSKVTMLSSPIDLEFDVEMTQSRLSQSSKVFRDLFDTAVKMALTCKYDMLILDGIFDTFSKGFLTESQIYEFLSNVPDQLEVICTGESVSEKFLLLSNYSTKFSKIDEDTDDKNISDNE